MLKEETILIGTVEEIVEYFRPLMKELYKKSASDEEEEIKQNKITCIEGIEEQLNEVKESSGAMGLGIVFYLKRQESTTDDVINLELKSQYVRILPMTSEEAAEEWKKDAKRGYTTPYK